MEMKTLSVVFLKRMFQVSRITLITYLVDLLFFFLFLNLQLMEEPNSSPQETILTETQKETVKVRNHKRNTPVPLGISGTTPSLKVQLEELLSSEEGSESGTHSSNVSTISMLARSSAARI